MGAGDRREQSQQIQYPQSLVHDYIGDGRVCFLLVSHLDRYCARIRRFALDGLPVSFHDAVAVHPK